MNRVANELELKILATCVEASKGYDLAKKLDMQDRMSTLYLALSRMNNAGWLDGVEILVNGRRARRLKTSAKGAEVLANSRLHYLSLAGWHPTP